MDAHFRPKLLVWTAIFGLLAAAPVPLAAQDEEEEEEVGIRDNSFLVEEAYNQEPGVIQHIFNLMPGWDHFHGVRTRGYDFLFTQEWPVFSQRHQFSYSIPTSRWTEQVDGGPIFASEGIGDIMLNYRYQLLGGVGKELACSPRFSLVLPSGDENQGLGFGKVGYQFNLPVSKEFDNWAFHFNAGLTVVPEVHRGVDPELLLPGRSLNGYNLGASAIYFLLPNFHLVLETVAVWEEDVLFEGTLDRAFQLVVNPGVRWAPYTKGETQWVLGLATPIGLTDDATDFSLFFYMSFEHPFTMAPKRR